MISLLNGALDNQADGCKDSAPAVLGAVVVESWEFECPPRPREGQWPMTKSQAAPRAIYFSFASFLR
jgi:hypothetical protein